MDIKGSPVLSALGGYAFAELDRLVEELRGQGIAVIDYGVGDPQCPTPELIRRAAEEAVESFASAGYPSYVGAIELRREIAAWNERRFGVALSPDEEIAVTLGSKEAVFHFPFTLLRPGEVVLVPTPGYPPYHTGARFAGGEPYFFPLLPERGFLPDLDAIPAAVLRRARILWLNYPNSPTGVVPPDSFYVEALAFARRHQLVLASDEAYSELYFGERPPRSFLEFGREGVVVFQSLSKRSAMTGYRSGWVCGDRRLVSLFKKLKTNIDSGSPHFVQAAAIAALRDEEHVVRFRADYGSKQAALSAAFLAARLPPCRSEATIYLWQPAPPGLTDVEYARALLAPAVACAVMPGSWISQVAADGSNPGAGFVRWALCPSPEEVAETARRLTRVELGRPS